ncbi:MAG: TIGR01212 family radical SAM protein, partial [Alistipes sp.]|nr:TIGR01212 family radical SAM protein [Alistipes sp.]
YIELIVSLLERLRPDLIVERFASEAPPRYHHGPTWQGIRNEQLWAMLEKRLIERDSYQGKRFDALSQGLVR